jgi:protein-S-isoprenylcysteine O-methyltransferase Ste14
MTSHRLERRHSPAAPSAGADAEPMSEGRSVSGARLAGVTVYVIAWPVLLFVLAGDARWMEGWLFTGWFTGLYATVTLWMYFRDPALLAERHRPAAKDATGVERQDRLLVLLVFLGFLLWIVLMPLDARRFHWTPAFPPGLKVLGGLVLLLSSYFLFRAFHDNTFLSGVTRIQSERKQRVVSTGVYGFVRHPMYLGMVLMFTGAPLLLGSRGGLAVAAAVSVVLAVRITREERLLADELDGYEEYRRNVRYRLLPLIW